MTKSKTIDLLISAMLVTGIAVWFDLLFTITLRNFLPRYPWEMIVNIFSVVAAYMLVGFSVERWQLSKFKEAAIAALFIIAYAGYLTLSFTPVLR